MRSSNALVFTLSILALFVASGCSLISGDDVAGPQEVAPEETGGTIIIQSNTEPAGQAGPFQFTGIPSGTITADATLAVADLAPGTYTTTQVDPAPDFDVTAVTCDDDDSAMASSGDPQTRTAVLNLDPGETVSCTFTNTRRGTIVIAGYTEPEAVGGQFQFTGVPSGTIPSDGTLVATDLAPGTYTTTQVDPAPDFDLTTVDCDDAGSATPSSGDPNTRSANFNVDPGELVTCTFVNTRRGTAVIASQVIPEDASASFQFTGIPSGTISANGTLVSENLSPGTYSTTEVDPAPEFELTAVECDDGGSILASSGDPDTRTAIFNIEPAETVRCLFTNEKPGAVVTPTLMAGGATSGGNTGGSGSGSGAGINPFENPGEYLPRFPLPSELPPGAGTFAVPKAGPWSVTNFAGQMSCGAFSLAIPASPPESGILEVLDGGQTLVGTSLQEAQSAPITMIADASINGLYGGSFQGIEQGVPVTIDFFWQVVTDEYIVGYLTAAVTAEGVSCEVYRSFEMNYTG